MEDFSFLAAATAFFFLFAFYVFIFCICKPSQTQAGNTKNRTFQDTFGLSISETNTWTVVPKKKKKKVTQFTANKPRDYSACTFQLE